MTQITKNYSTDGGDTLVIGGKLVIAEGATVEGLDGSGGGAAGFEDIAGTVSGADGENLQAILNDLATRLAAVEAG